MMIAQLIRASHVLVGVVLWLAVCCGAPPAMALTCTAAVSAPVFSQPDLLGGGAVDTVGSMSINCSGTDKSTTVLACPNLNAGSGNAAMPGPQRYLSSGARQLAFNLYQDAYATVWGGAADMGGVAPSVLVTTDINGNGSVSGIPIYGRIAAGQSQLQVGTYASTITVDVRSSPTTGFGCASVVSNAAVSVFTITTTYIANCIFATSNLNFGAITSLTAAVDAETALSLTCSNGSAYSVALDGGLTGATSATQRSMRRSSYNLIYGLYRDASRQQPWWADAGNVLGGTGSGNAQQLTVYGRIPAQTSPPPGTYQDTIVATVTY